MELPNLTKFQKGTIFFITGSILFLYSVGIFKQAFQFVIVIGALFLIIYGFILGDFWSRIKDLISQFSK